LQVQVLAETVQCWCLVLVLVLVQVLVLVLVLVLVFFSSLNCNPPHSSVSNGVSSSGIAVSALELRFSLSVLQ
jgi:hypothetical protein